MANAFDAIVEIFTWIGFGAGALLAALSLVLSVADGTWVRVSAMIDDIDAGGRVARWFDDEGGVGQARLTAADEHELGGADVAEVYVRLGSLDRMRLTRHSPGVRAFFLLAVGLVGLGVVALLVSVIALFARG